MHGENFCGVSAEKSFLRGIFFCRRGFLCAEGNFSGGRGSGGGVWGGSGGAGGAKWPKKGKKGGFWGGPGGGPKMGSFCPRVVHEWFGEHCVP